MIPSRTALEILDCVIDRSRFAPRDVSEETVLNTMRELERLGESATIPYILILLRKTSETVEASSPWKRFKRMVGFGVGGLGCSVSLTVTTIAETVGRLILAASPSALIQLDRRVRWSWRWEHALGWDRIEELASLGNPATLLGIWGLACSHLDGYVRERAVRRLQEVRDGRELPFLLLRLDDWVKPVQQVAVSAVQSRMNPEYASRFIACLPILSALSLKQRASETKLVEWIQKWLIRPQFVGELLAGLKNKDRYVRRAVLRLCAESSHISVREVIEIALRDKDVLVRIQAVRLGASKLAGQDHRWFVDRILQDAYARIRAEGLDTLAVRDGPAAQLILEAALLDEAETVRYTARFHLRKMGVDDFANRYRDALASNEPAQLRAALGGLEHTGTVEDAQWVLPFLKHEGSGVARSALQALAKLDRGAAHNVALSFLGDERVGVPRAAAAILHDHVLDTDLATLWEAITKAPTANARSRALVLVEECTWWVALPALLQALALADENVRQTATQALKRWLKAYQYTVYAPPTPTAGQRAACREALVAAAPYMEPELRGRVEKVIQEGTPFGGKVAQGAPTRSR